MSVPTLEGVTAKMVTTDRLTTRVLFTGPEDGVPVLFLHGNASSATWWEENMLALPALRQAQDRAIGASPLTSAVLATPTWRKRSTPRAALATGPTTP